MGDGTGSARGEDGQCIGLDVAMLDVGVALASPDDQMLTSAQPASRSCPQDLTEPSKGSDYMRLDTDEVAPYRHYAQWMNNFSISE